jgi:hypothetical protein
MNPYYAIMESRHRWLILAGLSFGAAFLGAIMMLAWHWPHLLIQVWFYAGAALAVGFLVQALHAWWSMAQSYIQPPSPRRTPERPDAVPAANDPAGVPAEQEV